MKRETARAAQATHRQNQPCPCSVFAGQSPTARVNRQYRLHIPRTGLHAFLAGMWKMPVLPVRLCSDPANPLYRPTLGVSRERTKPRPGTCCHSVATPFFAPSDLHVCLPHTAQGRVGKTQPGLRARAARKRTTARRVDIPRVIGPRNPDKHGQPWMTAEWLCALAPGRGGTSPQNAGHPPRPPMFKMRRGSVFHATQHEELVTMTMACTVCQHPDAQDIDAQARAGIGQSELSRIYGVSRHALGRHVRSGHVTTTKDVATQEEPSGLDLARLERFLTDWLDKAEREGREPNTATVNMLKEARFLAQAQREANPQAARTVSYTEDPAFLDTRDAVVSALADSAACGCRDKVVAALVATGEKGA